MAIECLMLLFSEINAWFVFSALWQLLFVMSESVIDKSDGDNSQTLFSRGN